MKIFYTTLYHLIHNLCICCGAKAHLGERTVFLITDISKKELQWAAKKGLFVFPVP
jgi:hypothetical protein